MPLRTKPTYPTPMIVIYGGGGIGKTTLAASIPHCLIMATENVGDHIASDFVTRRYESTDEILADMDSILKTREYEGRPVKAIALDTVTGLEGVARHEIERQHNNQPIHLVLGGFKKGERLADAKVRAVIRKLVQLKEAGILVIVLGHDRIAHFNDPMSEGWDWNIPRLMDETSEFLLQNADEFGYAHRFHRTKTIGEGNDKKTVGIGGAGEPVVEWKKTPAWQAKQRMLPDQTALSWADIKRCIWPPKEEVKA